MILENKVNQKELVKIFTGIGDVTSTYSIFENEPANMKAHLIFYEYRRVWSDTYRLWFD